MPGENETEYGGGGGPANNGVVRSFVCTRCYTERTITKPLLGTLRCPQCKAEMNHDGSWGAVDE